MYIPELNHNNFTVTWMQLHKTLDIDQHRSQSIEQYYSTNIYTDDFLIYQINRYTSAKAVNSKLPANNCQSQPKHLTANELTEIKIPLP